MVFLQVSECSIDGQVLADLGNGYEPVASACPYAYGYGCQGCGCPLAPQTPVLNYLSCLDPSRSPVSSEAAPPASRSRHSCLPSWR